jgi:biopolymer transport protein ExbD
MLRRKRRKTQESVDLNLAAMLDMAFQLLTFFILTFRPAPLEGRIDLRLPPPRTAVMGDLPIGTDKDRVDPLADLTTLVIEVLSGDDGTIGSMEVGGRKVDGLAQLDRRLTRLLADPGLPFQQVTIHVGSGLRYDALMNVIDVCSRQKLPGGAALGKLSFVELPDRAG